MSLLFQKIKCILCENTKPSAKLISFCHTTKKTSPTSQCLCVFWNM